MAQKQISYSDLRQGEKVTIKLREGESVIVGTVATLPTPGGGAKIQLTNNANSVVIYEDTNFRIFADRGPTVGDVIGDLSVGSVFTFKNRYGVVKTWVKSGADRATLVADDRPAHSLSISEGFPSTEEDAGRTVVVY